MKKEYTEEEIKAITAWAIKMIKFWGVSALLYIAVVHGYTLAWWILGSLAVLKASDWWFAYEKDMNDDKNN